MSKTWLEINLETMNSVSVPFLRACNNMLKNNKTEITKILQQHPEEYVCINHLATLGRYIQDTDYLPPVPNYIEDKFSYYNGVKNSVQSLTYTKTNKAIASFEKLAKGNPKSIRFKLTGLNYMEKQALVFMAQLQGWIINYPDTINYSNDNTELLFIRDRQMKAKELITNTISRILYYHKITADNKEDLLDMIKHKNQYEEEKTPFRYYLWVDKGVIKLVNTRGTIINTFHDNSKELTIDSRYNKF